MPAIKKNTTTATTEKMTDEQPKLMTDDAYKLYKEKGLWVFYSAQRLGAYAEKQGLAQLKVSDLEKLATITPTSRSCDCGCGQQIEALINAKSIDENGNIQTNDDGVPYEQGLALKLKLADGSLGIWVVAPGCIEKVRNLARFPKRNRDGIVRDSNGNIVFNKPFRMTLDEAKASLAKNQEKNQEVDRVKGKLFNPKATMGERTVFGGNDDGDVGNRPRRNGERDNNRGAGKRDRNWR